MAALESGLQKVQQEPSEALPNVVENNSYPSGWLVSIKEKLEQACKDEVTCSFQNGEVARSFQDVSIYKFPLGLKNGKDKAPVPEIVSLGPYHHGKRRLREMERHKWRCLKGILQRSGHEIDLYLNLVKKVEEKARACYEEQILMDSNDFIVMMVLDGCFVIELLRGFTEGFNKLGYSHLDPIFSKSKSMLKIQRDMLLLENQIPLFILDQLYYLQLGTSNVSITKLVVQFFNPLMPTDDCNTKPSGYVPWLDQLSGNHCLDVFWCSLLHSIPSPVNIRMRSLGRQRLIHCVMELWKGGINFSKRKTDKFWDIQFKNGTLEIPRLVINDGTRSLFLNLIAFEYCHFYCKTIITSYVIFMDNLINCPEDVRHLRKRGIIKHWLGSDVEVADLFHWLCQDVIFEINESYLGDLCEEVNNFCGHSWNSGGGSLMDKFSAWKARLKHRCIDWAIILKQNYFGNPWSIISLVAACVLLVLTFIQTLYTAYGYHRSRF